MGQKYIRVSYELIKKARSGDIEALQIIKNHFQPYIQKNAYRMVKNDSGYSYMSIDETLKSRLEIRLLSKILTFKIS
ncbi:helix-turn-helix domain-containing protein [Enterococcus casseliflavus]|uniref:helix-turn-helix domain-containing protein n=1 Tax=Enterococcus casseliflavus TaxID=37734 RepID=UPI001C489C91|nr:helix-turn-helix domain-containing protein [Enterococcus casseliflavus]